VRARLVAVVAVEGLLVAASIVVGMVLNRAGVPIHAAAPPLFARWGPHLGPGTPLALAVAVAVLWWGPGLVRRLPWRGLLATGFGTGLAWILSLALVDGWSRGLARRLTAGPEYLSEVHQVTDIPAMLAGFSDRILDFRPDSWATHVAGHPPGALLVFVWLDRIGLGGGAAAALTCVLVGATVAISVPQALKALGNERAARAALPFLVLFPGAVWVGASADGLFAGVVAAGLALLAAKSRWAPVVGGVLLGFSLYLSYGLALAAPLAVAVVVLKKERRVPTLVSAAAGVAAVVAAFTVAGFWWWEGYRLVVERYYQGWAADRPYAYWVWANLACLVLAAGPAVGPALVRAASGPWKAAPLVLSGAAALAIMVADLTGLSKAEVERIWLPFAGWLLAATACLPPGQRRAWLAVQAATALAVNHLLWTNW
jgi:methylthioxylose transferase